MQVSIIIVNYNTKDLIKNCLDSIYEHTKDLEFEIIISDNGSIDGSIEMIKSEFPTVILIENNANLGFGAANNRGLEIAKGKFIFYLNSDTILLNNAVKIFYDYWEENDDGRIGALGCNLQNSSGQIVGSYGELPNFKKYSSDLIHSTYGIWKLTFLNLFFRKPIPIFQQITFEKHIGEVGYIIGADLFLKNDEFAKFDERFFMYTEEADLEFQLEKIGKKRLLIDGPKIIHLEGGTVKKEADCVRREGSFSKIYICISQIIYFKKNHKAAGKIFLLKLFTLIKWLNPLIFKDTKKYIWKMIKI